MSTLVVRPLDESTWPAYADLIERHNGIWGGCWCMGFQSDCRARYESVSEKREHKRELVAEGRARAAVVFDGERAVGWCQFGRASEVAPRNKLSGPTSPAWWTRRTGGSPASSRTASTGSEA